MSFHPDLLLPPPGEPHLFRWVDSHAHLEMADFDTDRDAVIHRAASAGVGFILCVGNAEPDKGSMFRAIDLCERFPHTATTVGIHPHDAAIDSPLWQSQIHELAQNPHVWAMGEIGLDYHYDRSPRDIQRKVFRTYLRMARELELPVVIHSREADHDTLSILEKEWAPPHPGGVMHCFTGDEKFASACVSLNLSVSFSGVLTFPNAHVLRRAAAAVPPSHLLVETDCPYLSPVPFRGRRNEPAWVVHTAARLAGIHGLSLSEMAALTTANFQRLFVSRFTTTPLSPCLRG